MMEFSRKTVVVVLYVTLIMVAIIDSIGLLGGLPWGPFNSQPWLRSVPGLGQHGLWDGPVTHRLDAYVLLWWIRILTLAKGIVVLALGINLYRFQASQGRGENRNNMMNGSHSMDRVENVRDKAGRWIMILSCWHLLATSVQMPTFLFAYTPVMRGMTVAIRGAPAKVLWGMPMEVFLIALAAYLRKFPLSSSTIGLSPPPNYHKPGYIA